MGKWENGKMGKCKNACENAKMNAKMHAKIQKCMRGNHHCPPSTFLATEQLLGDGAMMSLISQHSHKEKSHLQIGFRDNIRQDSHSLTLTMQERKKWRKDHRIGVYARPTAKDDGSSNLSSEKLEFLAKRTPTDKVKLEFNEDYPSTPPTAPPIFIPMYLRVERSALYSFE